MDDLIPMGGGGGGGGGAGGGFPGSNGGAVNAVGMNGAGGLPNNVFPRELPNFPFKKS